MTCPCKGCEFRSPPCWGVCEQYKEWKAALDAGKAKEQRGVEASDFRRRMIVKQKRKMRIER